MSDLHANYDNNQGEIVIYQSENGDTKIDVHFVDESTCRKFRQVRMEGLRQVTREIPHTITWT